MKRIGALVLVVAAAALLSGAANGKDLQHLEVGSLTLKDKDGKKLAWLGVKADGSPLLALYDKDGTRRAVLKTSTRGSAGLAVLDKDGKPRAAFGVRVDGSASLVLAGKDGTELAKIAENTLTLFDAKGNVIWQAPR